MISKKDALEILDRMDDFRRRHQNEKESPSDYCMRVLEAIVGESAGFNGRNSWTEELSADSSTKYAQDIKNLGCTFNG